MGAKKHPDYSVPALDKGLDLMEAMASAAMPLSLSELARAAGQAPSAAFRLLNRLERRGYVARDPVSGQYRLSLKLMELAHTYPPVEHLTRVAGRFMRELADSVRESVHLSVLDRGRLVVLMDEPSPMRVRFAHQIGGQFSPLTTNSGRLLLAYLGPEMFDAYVRDDKNYTKLSKSGQSGLLRKLKAIRRAKYAISPSEERAGLADIAVLVGNPTVGAAAALAIACLETGRDKESMRRLVKQLQKCASDITAAMGLSYDSQ